MANVDRAYHAVSLDDNRAQIFTPILLTSPQVQRGTPDRTLTDVVEEVWFAGSHTDVGGGASRNPEIANTPLNWILARTRPLRLFRDETFPEPPFQEVKNMQEDLGWVLLYKKVNRDLGMYHAATQAVYNRGRFKIHESVMQRLAAGVVPAFKVTKKDTADWFDRPPFAACFARSGKKRLFLPGKCSCIEVISTKK